MAMTGLSPAEAKQQIYDFYEEGMKIEEEFSRTYLYPFFKNLGKAWTSPKAVEFGNDHFYEVRLSVMTYQDAIHNICVKAVAAYNSLASSNGAPTIADEGFTEENNHRELWNSNALGMEEIDSFFHEASPEGVVGMDDVEVNNQVELFKAGVDKFIAAINNLPLSIAFYDPDGELQLSYKQMIKGAVDDVTSTTTAMYDAINNATASEIKVVQQGLVNASSDLSGN